MKQFILWFLLLPFTAGAQIALENTYNGSNNYYRFGLVKLSASGHKYVEYDTSMITLYNLNHSIFRQINIPPLPNYYGFNVHWISEELFNTNAGDIEYLVTTLDNSSYDANVTIFDEPGNVIFSRDTFYYAQNLTPDLTQLGILPTANGVKMILAKRYSRLYEVYSLPGILPCEVCSSGVLTGIAPYTGNAKVETAQLLPFPNPTTGSITIPYTLPPGERTGELIITNLLGQEVRRLQITSTFSTIVFEANELPAGSYLYYLQVHGVNFPGSRFVVGR